MVDANEEKKNCPDDSRFKQQTLPSWQPILTPFRVIVIFLVIGVIFLPVGVLLLDISDYLKEMTIVYDGTGINSESITNSCETDGTATSTCTVSKALAPLIHRQYLNRGTQANPEFIFSFFPM